MNDKKYKEVRLEAAVEPESDIFHNDTAILTYKKKGRRTNTERKVIK